MVNVKFKNLKEAAKKVAKSTKQHFKKDGWDLDYSELVADVFYTAFGHHLENYLLEEICKFRKPLALGMKDGVVVLTKKRPKKGDLVLGTKFAPSKRKKRK